MNPDTSSNWTSGLELFLAKHGSYDVCNSAKLSALEGHKNPVDGGNLYSLTCASAMVLLLYDDEENLEHVELLCGILLEKCRTVLGMEHSQTVSLT